MFGITELLKNLCNSTWTMDHNQPVKALLGINGCVRLGEARFIVGVHKQTYSTNKNIHALSGFELNRTECKKVPALTVEWLLSGLQTEKLPHAEMFVGQVPTTWWCSHDWKLGFITSYSQECSNLLFNSFHSNTDWASACLKLGPGVKLCYWYIPTKICPQCPVSKALMIGQPRLCLPPSRHHCEDVPWREVFHLLNEEFCPLTMSQLIFQETFILHYTVCILLLYRDIAGWRTLVVWPTPMNYSLNVQ